MIYLLTGNYLIRGELLALHEAYRENGVQPYVDCAELTITGSGNAKPSTVKFPGAYKPTDPGILINIYNPITNYVIPGPAVHN
jgi:cellulase